MTFILTELSDLGIIMAADSSETVTDSKGKQHFQECNKIICFPEFNIGISTWGDATVNNKGINKWLEDKITEFKRQKGEINFKNKFLEEVAEWIAKKLNEVFPNGESVMRLHITGYNISKDNELRPGIFHVHNHNEEDIKEINRCLTPEHRNGSPKKFVAEKTMP